MPGFKSGATIGEHSHMSYVKKIDSLSLGLLRQDNWAFWGAKRLFNIAGLTVSVLDGRLENPDVDVLIAPRVNKMDEDALIRFVAQGGVLITEGDIKGTEFERVLGISEECSPVHKDTIVLRGKEGDVLLPALIECAHKGNLPLRSHERHYEIDGGVVLTKCRSWLLSGRFP